MVEVFEPQKKSFSILFSLNPSLHTLVWIYQLGSDKGGIENHSGSDFSGNIG